MSFIDVVQDVKSSMNGVDRMVSNLQSALRIDLHSDTVTSGRGRFNSIEYSPCYGILHSSP